MPMTPEEIHAAQEREALELVDGLLFEIDRWLAKDWCEGDTIFLLDCRPSRPLLELIRAAYEPKGWEVACNKGTYAGKPFHYLVFEEARPPERPRGPRLSTVAGFLLIWAIVALGAALAILSPSAVIRWRLW